MRMTRARRSEHPEDVSLNYVAREVSRLRCGRRTAVSSKGESRTAAAPWRRTDAGADYMILFKHAIAVITTPRQMTSYPGRTPADCPATTCHTSFRASWSSCSTASASANCRMPHATGSGQQHARQHRTRSAPAASDLARPRSEPRRCDRDGAPGRHPRRRVRAGWRKRRPARIRSPVLGDDGDRARPSFRLFGRLSGRHRSPVFASDRSRRHRQRCGVWHPISTILGRNICAPAP